MVILMDGSSDVIVVRVKEMQLICPLIPILTAKAWVLGMG